MKTAVMVAMMVFSACATGGDEETAEVGQNAIDLTPYHWMTGTWDCVSQYTKVEEAGVNEKYSMIAEYTAQSDGAVVRGLYRETPDGIHAPRDFDDSWEVEVPLRELKILFDPLGHTKATHYSAHSVPGSANPFAIEADGGIRLPGGSFGWGLFLNSLDNPPPTGTIAFGSAAPISWSSGGGLDNPPFGPFPNQQNLVMDRRVDVPNTGCPSCGGLLSKQYVISFCIRRPE